MFNDALLRGRRSVQNKTNQSKRGRGIFGGGEVEVAVADAQVMLSKEGHKGDEEIYVRG